MAYNGIYSQILIHDMIARIHAFTINLNLSILNCGVKIVVYKLNEKIFEIIV